MSVLQEFIDLDGDLKFTATDLDIAWAYLQVKKLLELGNTGVTTSNFRQKVDEMYNLNKDAGIAEVNTNPIIRLPGKLALGLPRGKTQVVFVKKWSMNDMFNDQDPSSSRDNTKPTDLYESVSGEIAGTITNPNWITTTNATNDKILKLNTDSVVSLNDGAAIRNDKSWTLHFKFKLRSSYNGDPVILVSKGYDLSTFTTMSNFNNTQSKNDPCMAVVLYPKASGGAKISFVAGDGVKNWFSVPFLSKWALINREIDCYIIRDGQNISFAFDMNDGSGVQTSEQEIAGALPTVVNMEKLSDPVVFSGEQIEFLEDVWIADNELKEDDVKLIEPPAVKYKFASDLNEDSSYFAFKNLFQDKFGNYAQIFRRNISGTLESDQTHWDGVKSQDGTKHNFTPRDKVLKLGDNETCNIFNVNASGNFTISFWARTAHRGFIIEMVNSSGNGIQMGPSWKADHNIVKVGDRSQNIYSNHVKDITDDWIHYTLVKNRNLLGVWVNEKTGDYNFVPVTNSDISNFGFCTLKLLGASDPVYFADLRVLDYAVSHIPARGYGKRTSYWNDFMKRLKARQD